MEKKKVCANCKNCDLSSQAFCYLKSMEVYYLYGCSSFQSKFINRRQTKAG